MSVNKPERIKGRVALPLKGAFSLVNVNKSERIKGKVAPANEMQEILKFCKGSKFTN